MSFHWLLPQHAQEPRVPGATLGARGFRRGAALAMAMVLLLAAGVAEAIAQDSSSKSDSQQVPEAGGPQGDIGPYSVPKKTPQEAPPPERPRPPKNPPEIGTFSITKDVALVNVPVVVTTANGQFVPGLQAGNFRVFEDGTEQKIANFNKSEAPITAVLLVEFADIPYQFLYDTMTGAYSFAQTLKKDDWIAVMYYDMKPHILTDFTQDKGQVFAALRQLQIPGFHERNLFDALNDTIDRVEGLDGHKYIILIGSGLDTFSRITYDKMLKRVKGTKDITIYCVSTGFALRNVMEASPSFRAQLASMDYIQADNELDTFAKLTGGRHYSPRFQAEFPEIFHDVGASIRNQYVLSYHPTNPQLDGTYRKLKIEVVDPQTGAPLKVMDQKGKNVKYVVVAREGYTAKHQVD
jgi:VWFA-related protein